MSKLFYPNLAISNIRRNSKTYIPFLITCIGTIMMYCILHTLSANEGLGGTLKEVLRMGTGVIGIFSAIFLFYTNQFLMKQRKKELALYNILGMEKKHITKMLLFETIFIAGISLGFGLTGGMILSKLMFLILLKIISFPVQIPFSISFFSIQSTIILFFIIFIAMLVSNLFQIHLVNPIELLRGGRQGEKEPKTKWILSIIGILSLTMGYAIALIVQKPLDAISYFFVAVILVMIGTYALFTAGSIMILKMLKKNHKFYYQTKHFIAVSGLIYRMKQNAVGLANICILSSAVLVMLSTTVSLYIGQENSLNIRYPYDVTIDIYNSSKENNEKINKVILEKAEKHNISLVHQTDYQKVIISAFQEGKEFQAEKIRDYSKDNFYYLEFISLEDYNRLTGKNISLKEGEAIFFSKDNIYLEDTLCLDGIEWKLQKVDSFPGFQNRMLTIVKNYFVVIQNLDEVWPIYQKIQEKENPDYCNKFNLEGEEQKKYAFLNELRESFLSINHVYLDSRHLSKEEFYILYGGLLFLGIFLGILFLMATVLIIYYKQISEGYDDKDRFEIMQKVGMTKEEVKKSIKSQIIMVFFLPFITAVIHIMFAFPVITKLLAILYLENISLFLVCTIITILLFGIIYCLIYSFTARIYYKIVKYNL